MKTVTCDNCALIVEHDPNDAALLPKRWLFVEVFIGSPDDRPGHLYQRLTGRACSSDCAVSLLTARCSDIKKSIDDLERELFLELSDGAFDSNKQDLILTEWSQYPDKCKDEATHIARSKVESDHNDCHKKLPGNSLADLIAKHGYTRSPKPPPF